MSLVKGQSSAYVTEEVTRGTYVAPTLDAHGFEPNEDGYEPPKMERDVIERNTLSNSIEAVEPRLGKKNVSAGFSLEFKAGATAGAPPRGGSFYKNLLGAVRTSAGAITTKSSGNTTTFLAIEDADIGEILKGDSVLVKKAGAFMVRPVESVVNTPGSAGLNLKFALDSAPGASVVIEKVTTYYHASNEVPLSVTTYEGGEIESQATGMDVASGTLENWSANETPSFNFSLRGLDLGKDVAAPAVAVDFSNDALVPVMQNAKAYLGGVEIDYVELGLSIENTLVDQPAANRAAGKVGTRKTALDITGSINPYMEDDNVDRWDNFNNGDVTHLFAYAGNPTGVDGEFNQVVAMWLPKIKITNMPTGDQDGVLTDNIEFSAFKTTGNDSIFLSFI